MANNKPINKIIITSERSFFSFFYIKELWNYRHLLFILGYRDFKIRYVKTFLGFIWAIFNPLITLGILTFVFGRIVNAKTEGIPHLIYTLAGLGVWTFFSSIVSNAGGSIVGAQNMIKKIYFPRAIIPISKVISASIDFFIVLFISLIIIGIKGYWSHFNFIYILFFYICTALTGVTLGLWISAFTVRYRDIQYITPIILRLGMFLTPIGYSAKSVPDEYQFYYYLNPLVGITEGMRWSLIGGSPPNIINLFPIVVVIILFIFGLLFFHKLEEEIADII